MRALAKLLTALVLCLGSLLPAYAAPLGYDVAILNGPPCAFPGSAIDLNFQLNAATLSCHGAGSATGLLTLTRATAGYAQYQSGCWQQFPSGAFRITDKGLLIEEARTNSALWARDMTNAAWTKVNMTTAQTATGSDCIANSATTLTATAANATALQTIVSISQADTYSVGLKRISGSGTVNISLDGVSWTAAAVTTTWTRFSVTSTLLNPNLGIQIVTNGDVIAADFNQAELGSSFATSPILTTTVAVTRNTDLVQASGAIAATISGASSAFFQTNAATFSLSPRLLNLGNATLIFFSSTQVRASDNTNTATATIGGAGTMSGVVKSAYGMDNTSMTVVANAGTLVTQATSTWATQAAGQTPFIGNNNTGIRALNGYLQRVVFGSIKGQFNNLTSP